MGFGPSKKGRVYQTGEDGFVDEHKSQFELAYDFKQPNLLDKQRYLMRDQSPSRVKNLYIE